MKRALEPWFINEGLHLQVRRNISDRRHKSTEELVATVYRIEDARRIAAVPELVSLLRYVFETMHSEEVAGHFEYARLLQIENLLKELEAK